MKMIAMPIWRWRSFISSRICAWIVTSSAVVGSSAISRAGRQESAMAIIARWRMPARHLVRIVRGALRRLGDADEREHLDRPLERPSRG